MVQMEMNYADVYQMIEREAGLIRVTMGHCAMRTDKSIDHNVNRLIAVRKQLIGNIAKIQKWEANYPKGSIGRKVAESYKVQTAGLINFTTGQINFLAGQRPLFDLGDK